MYAKQQWMMVGAMACLLTLGGCGEGDGSEGKPVELTDAIPNVESQPASSDLVPDSKPVAGVSKGDAKEDLEGAIELEVDKAVEGGSKLKAQADRYRARYGQLMEQYELYAMKTARLENAEIDKRLLYAKQAFNEIEKALNGFEECNVKEVEARTIGIEKNFVNIGLLFEEVLVFMDKR